MIKEVLQWLTVVAVVAIGLVLVGGTAFGPVGLLVVALGFVLAVGIAAGIDFELGELLLVGSLVAGLGLGVVAFT